jgi:monoamine oxidase
MSVQQWIDASLQHPTVKDLLSVGVRAALSAEPSDVSMLYLIFYVATGGSFVNVMAVGKGADSYRFRDGARSLPEGLRDWIKPSAEGRLIEVADVNEIRQSRAGVVTVSTSEGSFTGRRCIVAMSPQQTAAIDVPGVPARRKDLGQVMGRGRTIKAFLSFTRPWWHDNGSSGYALSARTAGDGGGPVVWTMDNTWAPDPTPPGVPAGTTRYSLMAFIVGDHVPLLAAMSKQGRFEAILSHWTRIFGVPRSHIVGALVGKDLADHYHDYVWDESSPAGGCPAGYFRPGTFTKANFQALRAPYRSIHWAGSETGTDWVGGYMDGAIESAVRAAEEVLASLAEP